MSIMLSERRNLISGRSRINGEMNRLVMLRITVDMDHNNSSWRAWVDQLQSNPLAAPMHQYAPDTLEPNRGNAGLIDPNCRERHKYRMMGGHPDACQTIASHALDNRSSWYWSKWEVHVSSIYADLISISQTMWLISLMCKATTPSDCYAAGQADPYIIWLYMAPDC